MTREAKIGMLTGLGVIVLIGVLLSNYLGPNPTAKMATLPVGASYRDQMTKPLGVPDALADAGTRGNHGSIESATPPQAFAVGHETPMAAPDMGGATPGQPAVSDPVTPVPAGQVVADVQPAGDKVPVFQLADGGSGTRPVSVTGGSGQPVKTTAVAGKVYKIAQGDTLGKIAAKYYKSSKPENVQRIVAANPGMLKNVNTMLVVGKTLILPDVPGNSADAGKAVAKADSDGHAAKPAVIVHLPGAKTGDASAAKSADVRTLSPKAAAATASYVVKPGDTLEKIARKLSATHYMDVAKQISALNKIKDPDSLQVGQTLKVPTKV